LKKYENLSFEVMNIFNMNGSGFLGPIIGLRAVERGAG
jgi:hypothetical protein